MSVQLSVDTMLKIRQKSQSVWTKILFYLQQNQLQETVIALEPPKNVGESPP